MIEKQTIQNVFEDIQQNGEWDINGELLYGYFFLDKDLKKLKIAGEYLEKNGYKFVDIFKAEQDEDAELDLYFLHIEKVEIHTADSLFERNMEFYRVADNFGLNSYDGFDIGQA